MQTFEYQIRKLDKGWQVKHNDKTLPKTSLDKSIKSSIFNALYLPKRTRGKVTELDLIVIIQSELEREVRNES